MWATEHSGIGPQISSDFPEALAAPVERAETA